MRRPQILRSKEGYSLLGLLLDLLLGLQLSLLLRLLLRSLLGLLLLQTKLNSCRLLVTDGKPRPHKGEMLVAAVAAAPAAGASDAAAAAAAAGTSFACSSSGEPFVRRSKRLLKPGCICCFSLPQTRQQQVVLLLLRGLSQRR